MVDVHTVSISFMFISGLVSLVLVALAVSGYMRNRDPAMGFLAGAFTLFAVKSFLVGYSLATGLIGHSTLELVDAVGDMGTILLIALPLFLPARD